MKRKLDGIANRGGVEQIVGPARRKRVSYQALRVGGWVKSRRPVNSDVRRLPRIDCNGRLANTIFFAFVGGTMKTLFVLASVIAILFLAMPNEIEAQKREATRKTNQRAAIASAGECSVVVRNDLLPNNRGVVVVGCDSFGIHEHFINMQGQPELFPSNGGILVFDADGNLIFKWQAQMLLGVFDRFVGIKKVQGHNALMVRIKGGSGAGAVLPLYFNGKTFTFAEQ